MSLHKELTNKEEYDSALSSNAGKYVLIFAYEGEVNPKAEEAAAKYADKVVNYKVDVSKNAAAKAGLNVSETPAVIIFKDGAEVKRVQPVNPQSAPEIHTFLTS